MQKRIAVFEDGTLVEDYDPDDFEYEDVEDESGVNSLQEAPGNNTGADQPPGLAGENGAVSALTAPAAAGSTPPVPEPLSATAAAYCDRAIMWSSRGQAVGDVVVGSRACQTLEFYPRWIKGNAAPA